jgi:hypothetical protein
MKNLLKINLVAVFVLVLCTLGTAQDKQQHMNREKLAKKQANYIATQMAFDETTTKRFTETYCAYQQELWALGPNHKEVPTNDEEAEQAIKERFERSQQILNLREKYYGEYSKFLSQSQIQQVYKLERQTMNRLHKHRGHNRKNHEGQ